MYVLEQVASSTMLGEEIEEAEGILIITIPGDNSCGIIMTIWSIGTGFQLKLMQQKTLREVGLIRIQIRSAVGPIAHIGRNNIYIYIYIYI